MPNWILFDIRGWPRPTKTLFAKPVPRVWPLVVAAPKPAPPKRRAKHTPRQPGKPTLRRAEYADRKPGKPAMLRRPRRSDKPVLPRAPLPPHDVGDQVVQIFWSVCRSCDRTYQSTRPITKANQCGLCRPLLPCDHTDESKGPAWWAMQCKDITPGPTGSGRVQYKKGH